MRSAETVGETVFEASWDDPFRPTTAGRDDFTELIEALRLVQERITRSRPTPEAARQATEALRGIAAALLPFEVTEDEQLAGRLWGQAGRGQALAAPIHLVEVGAEYAAATVTLSRFHAGRRSVHGGVIPLIFDEIMARLANSAGRPQARTAYLNVNFSAIAPLDEELRIKAELVGEEGRKRLMRARLYHRDRLLADGEGLWVALKPGQP